MDQILPDDSPAREQATPTLFGFDGSDVYHTLDCPVVRQNQLTPQHGWTTAAQANTDGRHACSRCKA